MVLAAMSDQLVPTTIPKRSTQSVILEQTIENISKFGFPSQSGTCRHGGAVPGYPLTAGGLVMPNVQAGFRRHVATC